MDKYIKVFCDQNPNFELECGNCKANAKVKSKELFRKKTYEFKCKKCNEITLYDTSKFVKGIIKQLKELGITVE